MEVLILFQKKNFQLFYGVQNIDTHKTLIFKTFYNNIISLFWRSKLRIKKIGPFDSKFKRLKAWS